MDDSMMAKPLISAALWERIEPLFSESPPHPKGGRSWVGNRRLLTDILTAANVSDIEELLPLVDGIPQVRGKPSRPRQKHNHVKGDLGYDSEPHRKKLRQRGIKPMLAKRNTEHECPALGRRTHTRMASPIPASPYPA